MPVDRPASFEGASSETLVPLLYGELRAIAAREHRWAGSPMTLQPTAIVGEAYLRIKNRADWHSRSHFLGCAATAMRHVLVDAARARLAAKRAGRTESPTLALDLAVASEVQDRDLVRLGEALAELARRDPQLAKVVDCRFFVGLDERETAEVLGVSDRTVRRWWTRARAWIHREMTDGGDADPVALSAEP